MKNQVFEKWVTGAEKQLLLRPGKRNFSKSLSTLLTVIAGAGKTFVLSRSITISFTDMRSRVIDALKDRFKDDEKVAVIYFCLDHEAQQQQTFVKIISTLLKQLLHSLPILPSSLKTFYDQHSSARSTPEPQGLPRLTEIFEICGNDFKTVYIGCDALDECTEGTLTNILFFIQKCSDKPSLKVIATSRRHPSRVHDLLRRDGTLHIEIDDLDIKNFLQKSMDEPTTSHISVVMKSEIVNTLGKNAQGM